MQTPIFRSTTIAQPEPDPTAAWIDPGREANPGGGGLPWPSFFQSSPKTIKSVRPDGTPVFSDGTVGQPGTATPSMVGQPATSLPQPVSGLQGTRLAQPGTPLSSSSYAANPTVVNTPAVTPKVNPFGVKTAAAGGVPWGRIIDAGGQALGTYLQNRSQNKAIDAQKQANQQAQEAQQKYSAGMQNRITQTQETQRQLYSPYTALGAGAAGTLASRMGFPAMPQGAPGMQPGLAGPTTYSPNTQLTPVDPGNAQGLVTAPTGPPLSNSTPTVDPKTGGTLAQLGMAGQQQQAENQSQSGFVMMQSPDGEVGQVPAHAVAFYKQKGAQVVA